MLKLAALAAADQCVKCGLCLPHCPTYGLHRQEADGPRGRIALAQGLLTGTLPATESARAHLEGCLACRACEAVCPAKVDYATVLDAARAKLLTPFARQRLRLLAGALRSRPVRALLRAGARFLQVLRKAPAWLPSPVQLRRPSRSPAVASRALFVGCVGDVLERAAAQDALDLFAALGQPLALPAGQDCCGALYQHGGDPSGAQQCAQRNRAVFAGHDTVLPLTPGCGAALRDLAVKAPKTAVRDLCAELHTALALTPLPLAALPLRVGVHVACTQANVFGAGAAMTALLQRIPGIVLVPLAPQSGCCGAAGTQMFTAPEQAAALRAPKLDAAVDVQLVVSANIGCSMHLAAGLKARGQTVEVIHPVTLLARRWRAARAGGEVIATLA